MSWTFANNTQPIARKNHYCDCCGIIIPKGYKYNRVDGKYDGEMVTSKTHPECDIAFSKATSIISDYIRPEDELFLHDLNEFMTEAGLDYDNHLLLIKEKYKIPSIGA